MRRQSLSSKIPIQTGKTADWIWGNPETFEWDLWNTMIFENILKEKNESEIVNMSLKDHTWSISMRRHKKWFQSNFCTRSSSMYLWGLPFLSETCLAFDSYISNNILPSNSRESWQLKVLGYKKKPIYY